MIDIWTVYDHPSDWPDWYVARRFDGEEPTDDMLMNRSLAALRDSLADMGLTCLARSQEDDPVIVETWL